MKSFGDIPVPGYITDEFKDWKFKFVFQPIFYANSNQIAACEALMRPEKLNILELIDLFEKRGLLHALELATFFGATKEYLKRGYTVPVAINSFPSEHFSDEETTIFRNTFNGRLKRGIVEILEYPAASMEAWKYKKKSIDEVDLLVAMDDFGTGINKINMVDIYHPNAVKIAREVISCIDRDFDKQNRFISNVEYFHSINTKIVAEGVETKEEYDFVCANGADYIQGYYTGRPV